MNLNKWTDFFFVSYPTSQEGEEHICIGLFHEFVAH